MLWLNGGPRASSITAGSLLENGPCSISYDNTTALGVDPDFNFTISSEDVSEAFLNAGQAMLNSVALLPVLINNGVRLLTFAGDTGINLLCISIGVHNTDPIISF